MQRDGVHPCPARCVGNFPVPSHLTARGDGREVIFREEADWRLWLALLEHTMERFGWRCPAYCLMPNHSHLLLETPQANLARDMRHLHGLYTQRLNRCHQRVGQVFQGR